MNAALSSASPLLQLDNEMIAYADQIALQNITLAIEEGEKVALIGRSGAGKTTLLRRLHQLRSDECTFVHQQHVMVSQLTTFHNIYMGRLDRHTAFQNLRNLIKPSRSAVDEIKPIASKLGLEEKLFIRVGELSGGQQQRVGIGRALYRGCSVLMADEPVSSLDRMQRREVMDLIVDSGRTVVVALHSVDLLQSYFKRIIGLKNRSIFFDLPVAAVSDALLAELYG